MSKRSLWVLLIILAAIAVLVILAVGFWPWLTGWLPHPGLIEAWIDYLVVDLNIGRWGPVATLLLVAIIELVWALNLGRKSGAFDRQWDRLERLHSREAAVLEHEVALLKEERQVLRAELDLREDLIREENARLWSQFEELQRSSGLFRRTGGDPKGGGVAILRSQQVVPDLPELSPDLRGEWRQIISQLERIEMISSVTGRKTQSALQLQQHSDELLRLGSACYYLGQFERALAHYNRAIELVPNNPPALINRSVVSQDLGRYPTALQDLEQVLRQGENAWAFLYRGLIRQHQGDEKRALEDYSRAVRLDPDFLEAYYRRGLLYAGAGEYDKAFQDQNRVLELDSNHASAYTARGVARAALGDTQWALNDLDKGCTLAFQSPEAFYHRGQVRHDLGMYDQALEDFAKAIELAPGFAQVFMARADTHSALDDHWQAINDYDRVIELQPKNAVAHHARGVARTAAREYRRAIEDYDRALELDPGLAIALANRGSAYEKVGEYEQAIRDLDRAVALDPNLAVAYYNRGLAYGSKGEYDRASRDLNKAVELDPSFGTKEQGILGTGPT